MAIGILTYKSVIGRVFIVIIFSKISLILTV